MLPNVEIIETNINHSFHINRMKVDYFPSLRHYHPEVEILLVLQGTGIRYVGNSVEAYAPGDLVMIGPNVPHEWCSDKNPEAKPSEAIYILFNTDILGAEFWNLPESKIILKIIKKSGRGIKLTGKTRDKVALLMRKIEDSYGFTRIIQLLSILELIAFTNEYFYLASPVVQNTINDRDTKRLSDVHNYVIQNIHKEISLEQAASIANLSKPAFCRYFKKRANKTFIGFLIEMRVAHACRLLINDNLSVAEVCFNCGFTNISYFIRQFKKITGFTPLGYRSKFAD